MSSTTAPPDMSCLSLINGPRPRKQRAIWILQESQTYRSPATRYKSFDPRSDYTVCLDGGSLFVPEQIANFHGDNAWVWQVRGPNTNILAYALSLYYLKSIDHRGTSRHSVGGRQIWEFQLLRWCAATSRATFWIRLRRSTFGSAPTNCLPAWLPRARYRGRVRPSRASHDIRATWSCELCLHRCLCYFHFCE